VDQQKVILCETGKIDLLLFFTAIIFALSAILPRSII